MAETASSKADRTLRAAIAKAAGFSALEGALRASFQHQEDAFRAVREATASVGRFTSLGAAFFRCPWSD